MPKQLELRIDALTYRTGDNLVDTYGVTSGISIFFR